MINIEQAIEIAQFDNNDNIHCFPYSPYGILGIMYTKENFIKILENADNIEIGDDMARRMEHAIVVTIKDNEYYFEHDEDKLKEVLRRNDRRKIKRNKR